MTYGTSAHRALRDWPSGTVTARLRRLLERSFGTSGAMCSCSDRAGETS